MIARKDLYFTGAVGGPVVAGAIFDVTKSYERAFYLGGLLFIICCGAMAMIPSALQYWPVIERSSKSTGTNSSGLFAGAVFSKICHPLSLELQLTRFGL